MAQGAYPVPFRTPPVWTGAESFRPPGISNHLANEIATGRRTVDDARRMYAEQIRAMKVGRPAPYTERLLFQPQPSAMDPDVPAPAM